MTGKQNPIRETDAQARAQARELITDARFAALGVIDPANGAPMVSRAAFGTAPSGTPISLMSDLSHHSKALSANPNCSLLIGEPGPKGDPLSHPRLTLQCAARFMRHGADGYKEMRDHYLAAHPKSQLYIDFADFAFAIFSVQKAHLNGGFGKAFVLTSADLGLT